jgi:hypothetical protein
MSRGLAARHWAAWTRSAELGTALPDGRASAEENWLERTELLI